MSRLARNIRENPLYQKIKSVIPEKSSDIGKLERIVHDFVSVKPAGIKVLDLGCGAGRSQALFESLDANVDWYGVDIDNSPEGMGAQTSEKIAIFDGVNLPFASGYFDIVYCNQVLEHVRYPDSLLKEASRVVTQGGGFIGSVSYLEPYHSYSIFNFTPFGVATTIAESGLSLVELTGQSDAFSLILRQILGKSKLLSFLWQPNYLYLLIELISYIRHLSYQEKSFLKIQFSGHLFFFAIKPTST